MRRELVRILPYLLLRTTCSGARRELTTGALVAARLQSFRDGDYEGLVAELVFDAARQADPALGPQQPLSAEELDARRLDRAEAYIALGEFSRAARVLTQEPRLDPTDPAVAALLRAAHPQDREPVVFDWADPAIPRVAIDAAAVLPVLARLDPHTAPGATGWSNANLRALAQVDDLA